LEAGLKHGYGEVEAQSYREDFGQDWPRAVRLHLSPAGPEADVYILGSFVVALRGCFH
jgi:hypothetical protein